jgi:hypothetical protein
VSRDGAPIRIFFVAGERELSAGLEIYCVLQPVEFSSTTEREKVNGVLPRSNKNSYVNYRTRLTLISQNYYSTSTLSVPSSPPGRYRTDDGHKSTRTYDPLDCGHLDNMVKTGTSCSTRATSGRFRVDFALLAKGCIYCNVQYRYTDAEDQVLQRLGA